MTTGTADIRPPDDKSWSLRDRFRAWLPRAQTVVYSALVLCLFVLGFLWQRMFVFVPPGHRGVMYRTVYGGTVTTRTWGEGLHVIPPWDKLTVYNLRLQQRTLDFKVLSDEGLTLGVKVAIRFRPDTEILGHLQKDIGAEYFDCLIKPEVESHIRRTFGGRPAHEVYASGRDVLQEVGQFSMIGRLEQSQVGSVSRQYVFVQELKLIQIDLPKVVEDAIVEKYHQEQLMLAYRYKLDREEKEADRKRTEAAGIRDFNQISGMATSDMLRWRSIDAAVDLAKSNNSKVIVLGGGQGGMSMQLNLGEDASRPPSEESNQKKLPPGKGRIEPVARGQKKEANGQALPPRADSGPSPAVDPRNN